MTTLQLRHDPYRHAALMRAVAHRNSPPADTLHSCDQCGAIPPTLYRYWWEPDDRRAPLTGTLPGREFCNLSCYKGYTS